MTLFSPNEEKIHQIASNTLALNTLNLDTGNQVIYAGGNQFRTLWVRDFCYSVDGLISNQQLSLVKFQLDLIFSFISKDGFLPRGLDFISPKWRVVQNTVLKWLPIFKNQYPTSEVEFKNVIKAEYLGEHGTPAIDSNALFILAYCSYVQATNDWFIPDQKIQSLLDYYSQYLKDDLYDQPPYSDWQDSVLRKGPQALLQLQVLAAKKTLLKLKHSSEAHFKSNASEHKILDTFFDPTSYLFYQDKHHTRFSLDCYGFIFRYNLFNETIDLKQLYTTLKMSPLWQTPGGPGIPVFPPYTESEVSWTTKAVGLRHYHDGFHWGWLIAEAAAIAKINNDPEEYLRILDGYSASLTTKKNLGEIYLAKENQFAEYSGLLYRSENPFTWTAAKWLATLHS